MEPATQKPTDNPEFLENIYCCNNMYMKKLLDSDWLRAVQFKCNTPVQKV